VQSTNIIEIIKHVFSSWQVLAVTIIILIYINLVSYVSKKHHTQRSRVKKEKKAFKKKDAEPPLGSSDDDSGSSSNDELGLEEA